MKCASRECTEVGLYLINVPTPKAFLLGHLPFHFDSTLKYSWKQEGSFEPQGVIVF